MELTEIKMDDSMNMIKLRRARPACDESKYENPSNNNKHKNGLFIDLLCGERDTARERENKYCSRSFYGVDQKCLNQQSKWH